MPDGRGTHFLWTNEKTMEYLPHLEYYTGLDARERFLRELTDHINADCWSVTVAPVVTPQEHDAMMDRCLGNNKHCRDTQPRQGCHERHELVFFNTGLLFEEIGHSFGVRHTPAYVAEQHIREVLCLTPKLWPISSKRRPVLKKTSSWRS